MSESSLKVSVVTSCYNGEAYLSSFINQLKSQSLFHALEWILIHNEPSLHEIEIVNQFREEFPGKITHIIRDSVEPLSVSWNRGWKIARAKYICFWNLDDCRPWNSLQQEVEVLEQKTGCAMTYGDYMEVNKYASLTGRRVRTFPYNRFLIQRKFPGGAFMVWSRNASDQIGYFDEQLKVACDYELVVRGAVFGLKMCKTKGVIGYFTNESKGLSTTEGSNQEIVERMVVLLRYGMFDKIFSENITGLEKYRISEIMDGGSWTPVSYFVKDYELFIKQRLILRKLAGIRRFLMKRSGGAR